MRISHARGVTRTAIHVHLSKKEQEQAMDKISILSPSYKTDSVLPAVPANASYLG